MTFIRPEFLYGLFALAIPVIIHLFNFRRHKKLYFSDISRLKNITTHTRKQQKLKHLIVLLLRMLAILFIVLALAGPELKKNITNTVTSSNTKAIYVDNSFSMMAEGSGGRLFENARQDALQLVEHSPNNTNFIILSNSNSGQLSRVIGKEVVTSELEKLVIEPNSKLLSQVISARNRIMINGELTNCETYIFSDFQTKSANISELPIDTINNYYLIPFQHLQNKNIYIDSCGFNTPEIMKGKNIGLTVWIKNDSDTDYEKVPLKLSINDQQKAVSGIDIKAGTTKQIILNFTVSESGWQHGLIEIEDFPITFDDKMYFAFNVKQHIDVLLIGSADNNKFPKTFYNSDDIFNISEMNYRSIDFSLLNNFDLIVLNSIPDISSGLTSKIKQYISDGGNLLFIPSDKEQLESNSIFLRDMNAGTIVSFDTTNTRVTRIKLSNQLFSESINKIPENADLPIVNQHYIYNFPIASGVETLVTLLSGNDFLSKKNIGLGQLYILSVGLNRKYGNFASHLLFVPIMHGVASKNSSIKKLYYTLGSDKNIITNLPDYAPSKSPFSLFSPLTNYSVIPGQSLKNGKLNISLDNINLQNGYYNLILNDSVISVFAFNYNRDESDMKFYNSNDINDLCEASSLKYYQILNPSDSNYTEVINALQKESDFWKLFIIFALSVIFMEILILRFWK